MISKNIISILLLFFLFNCAGKSANSIVDTKSRHDKWIEDLNYFETEFVDKSQTYSNDSVLSCKKYLKTLKLNIDKLDDNEIILDLSKFIAMANNGHTSIHLNWMKKIPFRFFWFADGLFIIKASNDYERYLGSKVLMINSLTVDKVQECLNPYLSGNTNWKRYIGTDYLCSPAILNGIGLTSKDSLRLTLLIGTDTTSIWFNTSDIKETNYESWENLCHLNSEVYENNGWKYVLNDANKIPSYLQSPDKAAYYKIVDSLHVAYLNVNCNWNKGLILNKLFDEFIDSIKKSSVKSIICDFRFNTGGNFMLSLKLAKQMPKYLPANSKIYLITSNMTFSAGIVTAARIKYFANEKIVIVGENVGDNLKFRSESRPVKLPNSGLSFQDAKYEHDWINNSFKPFKTYWFNIFFGVPAKDLKVDKVIRLSFNDFISKRDPIYDWIIKQNK